MYIYIYKYNSFWKKIKRVIVKYISVSHKLLTLRDTISVYMFLRIKNHPMSQSMIHVSMDYHLGYNLLYIFYHGFYVSL